MEPPVVAGRLKEISKVAERRVIAKGTTVVRAGDLCQDLVLVNLERERCFEKVRSARALSNASRGPGRAGPRSIWQAEFLR